MSMINKMDKKNIIIIAAVSMAFLAGCSSAPSCINIVPPDVVLTGDKTIVERHIVGDYMELEKDAWTVSSVKTSVAKKSSSGRIAGDPELLKFIKVRDFHNDKIKEYKTEGALGVTSTGYIKYMETKKYESSPAEKKILMTLIDEENKARYGIFARSIFISKGSDGDKDEIETFGQNFAEEQRGLAAKDEWIQENSGKWTRKK
jgi:hypothetical protein